MFKKSFDIKSNPDFYFILFLIVHVAVWTLIPSMTQTVVSSMDMMENFVWGKEFQLGYYKHPPFFAWVVGAWFYAFPVSDISYFLLSQVNVAIGFIFIYLLSTNILDKKRALLAVVLLEFIPFYTAHSIGFNANTVLISIWPALTFFFYKAVKDGSLISWMLTGILGGIALLSKYYSFILFIAMAFILFRKEKFNLVRVIGNKAAWIGLCVFFLVILPHLKWVLENDFTTLKYAQATQTYFTIKKNPISFLIIQLAYLAPTIFIAKFIFRVELLSFFKVNMNKFDDLFMYSITFIPYIFTFIISIVFSIGTNPDWGVPLWFLFTTIIMSKTIPDSIQLAYFRKLVAILFLVFLVIMMLMKAAKISFYGRYYFYGKELASFITNTWNAKYENSLRYVAGYNRPMPCISFYSKDHPSVLIDFNYKYSPWIKGEDAIKKDGIAIVCYEEDINCRNTAESTFKWTRLTWESIAIDDYKFSYAFIAPSSP